MHHGMLTVYKEKGYTSSDAVARLRGILRMRKIGHTGTLDPDAEGVLPMCLGNATRICELIADREKEYTAVMRLGVRTDTQDMSGGILEQISLEEIEARIGGPESGQDALERIREAAAGFIGEIEQVPPMYSAVKINGKRLYEMARKGITVERKARRIRIYALEVSEVDLPLVTLRVRCSKGTYIRTLCEDIGKELGTGAAMQSLLRTRVGQFSVEEAMTLDEIEHIAKKEPERLPGLIRPVDSFFADLPAAVCPDRALRLLKNGNPLPAEDLQFPGKDRDPLREPVFASPGKSVSDPLREPVPDSSCEGEKATDTGTDGEDRTGRTGAPLTEPVLSPAAALPGTEPGDEVIRVYDTGNRFYGLYRKKRGGRRFTAYKMFLPEA